jgi:tetratricopeptide (TPR) repeat protein
MMGLKLPKVPRWTMKISCFLISLLLLLVRPALADKDKDAAQMQHLEAARRLLDAHKPDEAITNEIDEVLKYFTKEYASESRRIYCARTSVETLVYLLQASTNKASAVVIGPEWAKTYYMKAYALIELGRMGEAHTNLDQALKLSPSDSQALSELAHLYQLEKKWNESQKLFLKAEECARVYSPEDSKTDELTRALRGQGYNLVELGKWNEAKAKYQECLKLNPNDKSAANELKYIESQSGKPK